MRPLKIALAVVVLSVTATVSGRGEEAPTQRNTRPRARRAAAALEQRVAALEKEVEALRAELAVLKGPPASTAALPEIKVIPLKNSLADDSARLVRDLFGPERDSQIGAAADARSNSVILTGPPERMDVIVAFLLRLDQSAGESLRVQRGVSTKLELQAAELNARVAQAEVDVKARQEQLERTERLATKGFVTKLQVEAEQAALQAAEAVLQQARRGLDAISGETSQETKPAE